MGNTDMSTIRYQLDSLLKSGTPVPFEALDAFASTGILEIGAEGEELSKAVRPGLTQKQIQVTRGGKTFTQTVWVKTGEEPTAAKNSAGTNTVPEKTNKKTRTVNNSDDLKNGIAAINRAAGGKTGFFKQIGYAGGSTGEIYVSGDKLGEKSADEIVSEVKKLFTAEFGTLGNLRVKSADKSNGIRLHVDVDSLRKPSTPDVVSKVGNPTSGAKTASNGYTFKIGDTVTSDQKRGKFTVKDFEGDGHGNKATVVDGKGNEYAVPLDSLTRDKAEQTVVNAQNAGVKIPGKTWDKAKAAGVTPEAHDHFMEGMQKLPPATSKSDASHDKAQAARAKAFDAAASKFPEKVSAKAAKEINAAYGDFQIYNSDGEKVSHEDWYGKRGQTASERLTQQGKITGAVKSPNGTWKDSAFSADTWDKMKSGDRGEATKYLKDMGVTWKENDNAGINWMRACMAATKAGKGGTSASSPATEHKPKNPVADAVAQNVKPDNGGKNTAASEDKELDAAKKKLEAAKAARYKTGSAADRAAQELNYAKAEEKYNEVLASRATGKLNTSALAKMAKFDERSGSAAPFAEAVERVQNELDNLAVGTVITIHNTNEYHPQIKITYTKNKYGRWEHDLLDGDVSKWTPNPKTAPFSKGTASDIVNDLSSSNTGHL